MKDKRKIGGPRKGRFEPGNKARPDPNVAIHYRRENIISEWRTWFRNRRDDPEYQKSILDRLLAFDLTPSECDVAEEMHEEYHESRRRAVEHAKSECPIGWFKPSWEQAQVLNAWHPDYEPHAAPEGYRSVCLFCGNQIGKTCVSVINVGAWMIPNDPGWVMFEEREDPPLYHVHLDPSSGVKRASRGKYRILPRPDWERWIRTGRMLYPPSDEPPMGACDCWHGVENDKAWSDKVELEYYKWFPKKWLGRRSDGGTAIYKQERRIESRYGHRITGKTFNADIQDWAGKANVRIVNIDEGIPPNLLREGLMRIGANGYFMWPYTAVEPRNIGERAKCAWDVYQGKLKLVGQTKFFLDFSMIDAPEHVMSAEKRADNLARLTGVGGEDKIRREGGFLTSSPNVFNNYARERNVLPIDGPDVLLAIRGEVPARWVVEFGQARADRLVFAFGRANIVRGMDEGLANPTACVWDAVLRTGETVTFREFEQSGLSVSERCREIVERSGNSLELLNPGVAAERRRYRERRPLNGEAKLGMAIRKTLADSKMFKRDPLSPQDSWVENYQKAGLRIERATNIGPAARCDYANDMLRADPTRQHLLNANQPGTRSYVTRDCPKLIERLENYLWQQIAQGQRAGEFTNKPENKDDHTVDAWCYVKCSKMRWHDPAAIVPEVVRFDRLTGAVVR